MAIRTHNGTMLPSNPIEAAARELLYLDKYQREIIKPRYANAVNAARFETACEIMHAMGFGRTPSMVRSVVCEATNSELNFEGLAFELVKIQRS
jgi:hypothetical protein